MDEIAETVRGNARSAIKRALEISAYAEVHNKSTFDRNDWTFGVNFYLLPNLVVKADYQILDNDTSEDLNDLCNLGIGWQF